MASPPEYDHQLIIQLRKGDHNAYKSIFTKYYKSLFFFILSYTRDKETAEDIVQDVLLHLWKNHTSLKIETSIKSYLYKACYNRYIDMHRSQARENKILDTIRYETTMMVTTRMEEDTEYVKSERIIAINNIIERLPPKCRKIFELSKMKGLKYKEIAEKMDISTKTVEAQISIAYTKIRNALSGLS